MISTEKLPLSTTVISEKTTNDASLSLWSRQRRNNKSYFNIAPSRQQRNNTLYLIITQPGQWRENKGYIIILPSQDKKGTTYDFSFITPVRTTNDVSFSPQSRQQGTLYAVSLIPQPGQWRDNTDFIIITQSRQRKDNKHFIIITQSGQQRDNKWCIIITPVRTTRKNKCCLIITTVRIRYIQNNDYGNRLWLINISFKTTRGQQIMVYYHGSQVNDGATNYVSL